MERARLFHGWALASERYTISTHSQAAAISVRITLSTHMAQTTVRLCVGYMARVPQPRFSRCREGAVAPRIPLDPPPTTTT